MNARIRVQTVDYHRNGVAGEGFFLVTFREGRATKVAVRFTNGDGADRFDNGRCAVLDPANPTAKWRGDYYQSAVDAAILEWEAESSLAAGIA